MSIEDAGSSLIPRSSPQDEQGQWPQPGPIDVLILYHGQSLPADCPRQTLRLSPVRRDFEVPHDSDFAVELALGQLAFNDSLHIFWFPATGSGAN